jgi:putative oxidoreductase
MIGANVQLGQIASQISGPLDHADRATVQGARVPQGRDSAARSAAERRPRALSTAKPIPYEGRRGDHSREEEETMQALSRNRDTIYGVLRIIAGLMFACHGGQKVLGMFGGPPPEAPALIIWIAGTIELVGGLLIAIGLLTTWAAFLASGLMAFAYFLGHQSKGLLPIQNGGELAVLYCWLFLYIAARGAGPLSIEGNRAG